MQIMKNEDILKKAIGNFIKPKDNLKIKNLNIIQNNVVDFNKPLEKKKYRPCMALSELDNWTAYDFSRYISEKYLEKTKIFLNRQYKRYDLSFNRIL